MSSWLYRPAVVPDARTRLFCFPYAGGGPAVFRNWTARLAPDVDLVGIRIPGRESRLRESPYSDWGCLVDDVVAELTPLFHLPFVLYGHSFGAMLAYEVARRLRSTRTTMPRMLILAACRSPDAPPRIPAPWDCASEVFWEWVVSLHGNVSTVVEDAVLRAAVEPAFRADLRLANIWRNAPSVVLDLPIVTFGGEADHIVSRADIAGWAAYTSRAFRHVEFAGGHFFLHTSELHVIDAVSDLCRAA